VYSVAAYRDGRKPREFGTYSFTKTYTNNRSSIPLAIATLTTKRSSPKSVEFSALAVQKTTASQTLAKKGAVTTMWSVFRRGPSFMQSPAAVPNTIAA
jgi:hypothetical protein